MGLAGRIGAWFGVDDGWERIPADPARAQRQDAALAFGFLVLGSLGVELMRSFDALGEPPGPSWTAHLYVLAGTVPLAWRRRWPLAVAGGLALHMLVTGLTAPGVMSSFPMQVVYFFALFTGVAWARDRRLMLAVVTGVILVMFTWLTWQFATGSGIEKLLEHDGKPPAHNGFLSPFAAYVGYSLIINVLYFGGAVIGGQAAWRAAQQRERLAEQAVTIAAQSEELQRQAVIEERMRIARELHDVVAHHISVIGIQAAAARRVLHRDPESAEPALRVIEGSSREAVAQMRGLLGTLRSGSDDAGDTTAGRTPEPTLADVPTLVDESRISGLDTSLEVIEDRPGSVENVPGPLGLSLYRTVQEALSNVRRHSTAHAVAVIVRVEHRPEIGFAHGFAEVEVLDNGRPRGGTSGTGLGLLGVRERLATHGGVSEIGPRFTGGYRVRVRMPLPQEPS
ncbi:MAG: histidine kinase [Micrococcales bacterium]|nr:histidine kinase [Micrococcales bacterium]